MQKSREQPLFSRYQRFTRNIASLFGIGDLDSFMDFYCQPHCLAEGFAEFRRLLIANPPGQSVGRGRVLSLYMVLRRSKLVRMLLPAPLSSFAKYGPSRNGVGSRLLEPNDLWVFEFPDLPQPSTATRVRGIHTRRNFLQPKVATFLQLDLYLQFRVAKCSNSSCEKMRLV